ncbi:hypothetical protein Trydic_g3197 [Trypoxylus dichotomus]
MLNRTRTGVAPVKVNLIRWGTAQPNADMGDCEVVASDLCNNFSEKGSTYIETVRSKAGKMWLTIEEQEEMRQWENHI